jgi:hypothetical protein
MVKPRQQQSRLCHFPHRMNVPGASACHFDATPFLHSLSPAYTRSPLASVVVVSLLTSWLPVLPPVDQILILGKTRSTQSINQINSHSLPRML